MPRTKKAKYKFVPRVHQIAQNFDRIANMQTEKLVVKDVLKGLTYEAIAEKRRITPEEARSLSKNAINRWATTLAHTASEAKEIDVKRMDALLERLHPMVFPEPFIDETLHCTVQPPPDLAAVKVYVDILKQRSALLGTEAAHKMETDRNEILQRVYLGVSANKQGVIDL